MTSLRDAARFGSGFGFWFGAFLCAMLLCTPLYGSDKAAGRLIILSSFPETLFARFVAAFEQRNPLVKVHVRAKKTSAAIAFLQERKEEPVDILWASAPDAFEVLKGSGHLLRAFNANNEKIRFVGDYPLDDPDGFYRGFAISGYGLMWNEAYLARQRLPPPRRWDDLRKPEFFRHVGISAPSRSGTTHLIVETLLQGKGWVDGWAAILEIGGNLATVTARSFGVRDGVRAGRFGVGLVVDFFGLSSRASGAATGFAYPPSTAFLPANIAIVKNAPNRAAAEAFVAFVLSKQGQAILLEPAISRLPIRKASYSGAPKGFPNPFAAGLVDKGIKFDSELSRKRYHLINSLFDVLITFELRDLNKTWGTIHAAQAALAAASGPKYSDLERQLRLARTLASKVPVSESQAGDTAYTSLFVRHRPGLPIPRRQMELELEWQRDVRVARRRARQIAERILAQLRSQEFRSQE